MSLSSLFQLAQNSLKRLLATLLVTLTTQMALAAAFSPQTRIGYLSGDQWEPAIAADGRGHIYVLYPQYGKVPNCPACTIPTMALLISDDNGLT